LILTETRLEKIQFSVKLKKVKYKVCLKMKTKEIITTMLT